MRTPMRFPFEERVEEVRPTLTLANGVKPAQIEAETQCRSEETAQRTKTRKEFAHTRISHDLKVLCAAFQGTAQGVGSQAQRERV